MLITVALIALHILACYLWYCNGKKDGYLDGVQHVINEAEWELLREKINKGGAVYVYENAQDGQEES